MKQSYIDLMERALSAYSDEHILRYFNDVRANGLTEHGFPRLTANIGILIAHGRRNDLLPIFREMMEFCCKTIPTVKAANDFSVREIISCLWEVEEAGVCTKEESERWRGYLATIEHETCYTRFATTPTDYYRNWVLFTAVSEYFRQQAGLCEINDFLELQLMQQLQWLDENGMYRDKRDSETYQPMMYDLVSRGLFALLLHRGYRGASYERIDGYLKKAALLTLDMQSPNGEMAFGGRSNQFLHNEAWMIAVFEYEANRYTREGNLALAGRFKAASARALAVTESWLAKEPIRHIKNRFPTETKYGCESYAYFDKYMITVASNLYAAYLICDDSIPTEETPDLAPAVCQTSRYFHKLFFKSGGYGLELDTNADPDYDATGLGRIHRAGAPGVICLSLPCPAHPHYTVFPETGVNLSLCSGIREGGDWRFICDGAATYEGAELSTDEARAVGEVRWRVGDGRLLTERYTVSERGVEIEVSGEGEIAYALPAFEFDGEKRTEIRRNGNSLTVAYEGWLCRYTAEGAILDLGRLAVNRNGHYRAYAATGRDALRIRIEILPVDGQ